MGRRDSAYRRQGPQDHKTYTAKYVVVAAGTWGTQHLLHKMKDTGTLPKLSDRLGELTRTNSESIVGAGKYKVDPAMELTKGVAITSSFHPTSDTHIEPVRYGKGSNAMGLLQTLMTDGDGPTPRWVKLLGIIAKNPAQMLRMLSVRNWSERTIIALVMQNLDNSITTYTKRGVLGRRKVTSRQGHGEPNPTWIPVGNEATRRIADKIDGVAAARGARCSTSRSRRTSSAGARSAPMPTTASSTRITACTDTRRSVSSTAPRSRPTWASTRR